jgi:hypothetical protein
MARRVTAAALIAVALLAGAASADDDKPWPGPPACSAVSERIALNPRGSSLRGVELWVQCNFLVSNLTIRPNRELRRVGAKPKLYRSDPGDRLTCRQPGPRRARCRGVVGQDARIALRLVLREPACEGRKAQFRVLALGGIDCDDGDACPSIGYIARVKSAPLAC